MSKKLSKQSFLALAAIAWSDGRLAPDEAENLLRAAKAYGVEGADLEAVEHATREKITLAEVPVDELMPFDAAVTFALASWLARIDGVVKTEEHASLLELAKHLGLDAKTREAATSAAFDTSLAPSSGRGGKYDFAFLIERLEQRLPSLAK
jgi:tellurite resistance protein